MESDTAETIITHADIGKTVAFLREQNGLTRQGLEKIAGYGGTTVSRLETEGKYKRQRGGYWRTICDLLDAMGYEIVVRKRK